PRWKAPKASSAGLSPKRLGSMGGIGAVVAGCGSMTGCFAGCLVGLSLFLSLWVPLALLSLWLFAGSPAATAGRAGSANVKAAARRSLLFMGINKTLGTKSEGSVFKTRRMFIEKPIGFGNRFRRIFRFEDGATERHEIRAGLGCGDDAFQRISSLRDRRD